MTLAELINLNNTITNIIETHQDMNIDLKFTFLGILKDLQDEVTIFEQLRQELIHQYGVLTDDGIYKVEPDTENYQIFLNKIGVLLKKEVSKKPRIPYVLVNELNLKTSELLVLYDFLEK